MRQRMLATAIFLGALCCWTPAAGGESLRLNCSDRYWYPFLYTQDDQVRGILYDIVKQAIASLKIEALVEPAPFRRAIARARSGKVDGLIAVEFQPDLSHVLDYPPAAEKDIESPWRIMQVDFVVVSVAEDEYEFEGDPRTLPPPVRVLQGTSIADELSKAGVDVQEVREEIQNFLKLSRDRKGVIVTTSMAAELMNRDPRFGGRIKIHATPVASRSYHLAFSKKSRLSTEDKERIWKEVSRWRDDYAFMLQVFSRY
jgi:ABC-type amino acid transport substrate-binding protein